MNSVETESVGIKRGHADDADGVDHLKKSKQDDVPPSKVIHIRQLPSDVQEVEVKDLGLPFGRITNCLLMKTKLQAFIELHDVDSAKTMLNYYQYSPPTVRNKQVFLQYSQHQELRINKPQNQQNGDDSNTSVLKVIVNNIVYPVTIDVLQQVFQRCGEILKIVTFVRNDQYHALIQYAKAKDAATARSQFDNQNIYNGCNMLRVDFSKMTELTVKYNNDKMRDYTKPDSPSLNNDQNSMNGGQHQVMNPGMLPIPTQFQQPQMLPQGFGMNDGGFPNIMGKMNSKNSMNFQPPMMGRNGGGMPDRQGSVLIVSNLVEGEVSCEDLFVLFGHYGDVLRVKILFNKKDTALIQFSDSNQANTALVNLNNLTLCGKELRVNRSKHDNVNMPKSSDDGKELTKDYAYSPMHRFKNPGSKNYQNIFPPIRTLHLSNIPETTPEDELQELFTEYGSILNFRFFTKDRKMALIQLSSIDEAVMCLIKVHNKKMNENNHLRISFAKNEMMD